MQLSGAKTGELDAPNPEASAHDTLARLRTILVGVTITLASLVVSAAAAGVLLWLGLPIASQLSMTLAAVVLIACFGVGGWAAGQRCQPDESRLGGLIVALVSLLLIVLFALPVAVPVSDVRSVAIALGWIEAPDIGTSPASALHELTRRYTDGEGAVPIVVPGGASARAIIALVGIGLFVFLLLLAGSVGAVLGNRHTRGRKAGRSGSVTVGVVAVAASVVFLAWPAISVLGRAVVDFDQTSGLEKGVNLTEVANHAETMFGETVVVSAGIHDLLGPQAALIGNDAILVGDTVLIVSEDPLEQEVLLAGSTDGDLKEGHVVQVTGTVRPYDPNTLPAILGEPLDEFDPDAYEGSSMIVVEHIDLDVPVAAAAGDPELPDDSGGYDRGITIGDIINAPENHVGLEVTVSSEVEEDLLKPHAFVLDDAGLLAISAEPRPELFVEATAYVTGEVRIFHLVEVERETGVDLDDAALRSFEGRPFILVESVSMVT